MMKYKLLKNEILTGFLKNKGKGYVRLYKPIDVTDIIAELISKYHTKNPNKNLLIVVDVYNTRVKILKSLQSKNVNIDLVKILSVTYINTKYNYKYNMIITVGLNTELNIIRNLLNDCTFMFSVITENKMNNIFNKELDRLLPVINTTISSNDVNEARIYLPVEESLVSVSFTKEEQEQYDKCSNYITDSISIFGNLDNIELCKTGDVKNNISASQIRYNLARENGWSEKLDTSIEFNKQIDDIYNPNSMLERANIVYNIFRERKNLLTDGVSKLPIILKLVQENIDKKILILSKRGEFARIITKHLCENDVNCLDYHDCIESMIAVDEYGNQILYKSGKKKGTPRIIGSRAISTNNINAFNKGICDILSIKESSDSKMLAEIDLLIITSPLCKSVRDIKRRFTNLTFSNTPNEVKTLYFYNSKEQQLVDVKQDNHYHKVIRETTDNNKGFIKNNGVVVL